MSVVGQARLMIRQCIACFALTLSISYIQDAAICMYTWHAVEGYEVQCR